MTKTRWYTADGILFGTQDTGVLIADIFENTELKDYTVLKIIGGVQEQITDAVGATDIKIGYGITVQNRLLQDSEWPSAHMNTFGAGNEDDEGFWMWRANQIIWADGVDGTTLLEREIETSTRRVVREVEDLRIVRTGGFSSPVTECYYWFRILILEN